MNREQEFGSEEFSWRKGRYRYHSIKRKEDPETDRNRLIALLDTTVAGIAIVEKSDGKVSFSNEMAYRIFGESLFHSPLTDRPKDLGLFRIDHTPYNPLDTPSARSLLKGETVKGEEMIVRQPGGNEIIISVNTSPLYNRNGEIDSVISVFYDITEKKEFEKKLAYQAYLVNNISDAVLAFDKDLNVIFWNESCEKLYGWTSEEALHKNGIELMKTRFLQPSKDVFFQKLNSDGEAEGNLMQVNKQGNDLYIHSKIKVLKSNQNEISEFLIVNRDVSERKKAEEALKESETRFSRIFENNPVAISISQHKDGRYINVNQSFLNLFGWSREEVEDKTSVDLGIFDPADREKMISQISNQGRITNYEVSAHKKNGDNLFLLISSETINIGGNDYLLLVNQDISDRKLAEAENRQLASIIELSSQAIAFSTLDGKILFVNSAMTELTGFDKEELLRIDWNLVLTAPEYRENEVKIRNEILETGHPARYEKEYLKKNGERVPVEAYLNVMKDGEGNPKYWFAFLSDISIRKNYEDHLHRIIRTLKAMQRSSQLIAKVGEEQEYLTKICNIIVEDCGHKMAWIGYKVNDERHSVIPVARAGEGLEYLDNLQVTWSDETPRGRGPVGTAIRKGEPVIIRNINKDPDFSPWKHEAQKAGFCSVIAFPVFMNNQILGAITIYSAKIDAFSMEELQLLMKLSDDMSHGITSIRLNQALKKAKEELEIKVDKRTHQLRTTLEELEQERQRVTEILNMIPAYVVVISHDNEIRFSNRIFSQEFNIENTSKDFFETREKYCGDCTIDTIFSSHEIHHWEWVAPNGKSYDVTDYPYTGSNGEPLVLEMGVDVTEKKNFDQLLIKKILETEEKDRRIFASDLHDDLGPTLSAIKLQLGLLISEIKEPSQNEMLVICDELLSDGIDKMKFVANSIMPSLIESFGIETAIKSFVNRISKNTKIQFHITSNLNGYRFPTETELHLYRIMTELIANTLKHSGATEVNLDLQLKENLFTLTYFDNGKGYVFKTKELHPTGIGLRNIQNRILLIGGEFRFFEQDGKTVFVLYRQV